MPEIIQDATPRSSKWGDKVVFTQAHVPERLDLRTTWQQSQEAGATIPCFMGSPSAR